MIGLTVILSACSFSLAADITPPPGSEQGPAPQVTESTTISSVYPIVPPDLANGAKIYNQECAPCHGTKGLGDGPQASQLSVPAATLGLSDFARLYTPIEWYSVVTYGNLERFMPAFANLTDRQRWDVVAYSMKLSFSDEMVAQGKTLFQENCIACHGQTGKGNGSDLVDLSTLPIDLTDQAFMAQNSAASMYQAISTGISPDMPAYSDILDENERWALVAYLRSLTYLIPPTSANAYPPPDVTTINPASINAYPAPDAYPSPLVTQSPLLAQTTEISPSTTFTGSLSVQLINGSGGEAPSDAQVTLYGFDDMQNTYSETLSVGMNGVYTFTNITMLDGRAFLAAADYASGTFGSDIVLVDATTPHLNLQVTVYDSTTDVSLLTTDRMHIFFDFTDPQNVQVVEVFIISNPSKQAVVAPTQDGAVVTFPLPSGYTDLQFQDGELGDRYVEVAQGFADTTTVNPGVGEYQVIFAFQMPYNRKLEFAQAMSLATSAVVVMVPENGVKVVSSLLQDAGTRNFNDIPYHMYEGGSIIAGSTLEFTLSGNPLQASSAVLSAGTGQSLAIGLGVFGLVLLAVGIWLFLQNRLRFARQSSSFGRDLLTLAAQPEGLSEDEDTLMDAIISLDDQFRAGNLPEEAYMERRAVLKDKLRNLAHG